METITATLSLLCPGPGPLSHPEFRTLSFGLSHVLSHQPPVESVERTSTQDRVLWSRRAVQVLDPRGLMFSSVQGYIVQLYAALWLLPVSSLFPARVTVGNVVIYRLACLPVSLSPAGCRGVCAHAPHLGSLHSVWRIVGARCIHAGPENP